MKKQEKKSKTLRKTDDTAYKQAIQEYLDADRPADVSGRSARVGPDTAYGMGGTRSENRKASDELLENIFRERQKIREETGERYWPKKQEPKTPTKMEQPALEAPERKPLEQEDIERLREKHKVRERMAAPEGVSIPLPKDEKFAEAVAAGLSEDIATQAERERLGMPSRGRPAKKSELLSNPNAEFPHKGEDVSGDPEKTDLVPSPTERIGQHLKKMHGLLKSKKKH